MKLCKNLIVKVDNQFICKIVNIVEEDNKTYYEVELLNSELFTRFVTEDKISLINSLEDIPYGDFNKVDDGYDCDILDLASIKIRKVLDTWVSKTEVNNKLYADYYGTKTYLSDKEALIDQNSKYREMIFDYIEANNKFESI